MSQSYWPISPNKQHNSTERPPFHEFLQESNNISLITSIVPMRPPLILSPPMPMTSSIVHCLAATRKRQNTTAVGNHGGRANIRKSKAIQANPHLVAKKEK